MTSTRRDFVLGSVALAAFPAQSLRALANEPKEEAELWFARPATRWMEAVPLGNGRIGAMVYGGVAAERIDLTESTVWSGAPSDIDVSPTALENLPRIRQLMFDGKYAEGGELCGQHLLGMPASFGTHLPMASLQIAFAGDNSKQRYRRSLSLDEAIAHVDYASGKLRFQREVFSSNPAEVLVSRLTCNQPASINCDLSFAHLALPGEVTVEGNYTLVLKGHAFEHLHSNGKQGVAFVTRVRVLADGGRITVTDGALHVRNADSVTLLVAIATSFRGVDPVARTVQTLESLRNKSYAQLRTAHVEDHQALYRRMSIDLGRNPAAELMPTDQRRKAVRAGEADPGLSALYFQYGRYLTIAGSRPNSPLPLALQGIWNDGLASSMGWADDFHLDINTQQNYWLAEVANLSECQAPLFNFIDQMRIAGQSTARKMYGAPGWVAHVVTNPWGYTAAGWGLGWGIFPTGGLWMAMQLWQHYEFTQVSGSSSPSVSIRCIRMRPNSSSSTWSSIRTTAGW